MLGGILSGVVWFGLFALSHVVVFHLRPVEQRSRMVVLLFGGALVGHVLTLALWPATGALLTPPGSDYRVLGGLAGLVTMGCLFVLYMPVYFTFATSQSVQAIVRIERTPERRLPVETLIGEATSDAILRQRLDSMVASGNLTRAGDSYHPTAKARRMAQIFGALQRLWRLDPVG
jgi:hypothetical protein